MHSRTYYTIRTIVRLSLGFVLAAIPYIVLPKVNPISIWLTECALFVAIASLRYNKVKL